MSDHQDSAQRALREALESVSSAAACLTVEEFSGFKDNLARSKMRLAEAENSAALFRLDLQAKEARKPGGAL